ncbi:polysaccharide biosynthesis protein [Flavobacteriaceae bacterium]|nr:polysaccharide biosynthesis protein [Flavobacteriaceae bacterium]
MFIVIPFISKEPAIFGIYSICISLGIFLNYADLGFLKATKKYAAEFYAREERIEEMKFLGFGTFILMLFTLLLSVVFFYFAFSPELLINGLDSEQKIKTASNLLLILAIFTPVTIFKRLIEMIYEIRLENFVTKIIALIGSLITICSVFYFFSNNNYMIAEYFLFFKIIDLLVVITSFIIAKRKYNYDLLKLLSFIKFNGNVYKKSYKLAYSGLYIMFAWVIFYELDQLFIGKTLGAQKVAIYAIALTFSIVFRQIFGIIFRPFVERSNHLVGLNKENDLKKLIIKIMILSAPLTIISTVAFSLFSKPIILTWVGIDYYESINIAVMLSLVFSFGFITYPTDMFLLAKEKIKYLYISATISPVIFWIGILVSFSDLGLMSLSVFKLVGTLIVVFFYIPILIKSLNISYKFFITKFFVPLLIPLAFLFSIVFIINDFIPLEKSKINFLIILFICGLAVLGSLIISYFTSRDIQLTLKKLLSNFKK